MGVRFFSKEGLYLKEALERISAAERQNEVAQKNLSEDLEQLRHEKERSLASLVTDMKEKRSRSKREQEQDLQLKLDQEKANLEQEATIERQSFQQLYEQRHETLVSDIIERVTSTYGG